MNQQATSPDKRNTFKTDVLFACSMIFVCSFCLALLIGTPYWQYGRDQRIVSANATATALALGTQRAQQSAHATATLVARSTQQAQYKFVERFDNNQHVWLAKAVDDEFLRGSIEINGGVYAWKLAEIKQPFYYRADFPVGDWIKDFDTYVDFKVAEDAPPNVCGGYLFRMSEIDWTEGAYIFTACNDRYFHVGYYGGGEWQDLSDWQHSNAIYSSDWNRLEISARGDHFVFSINHEVVYEMTDQHEPAGRLALLIEVTQEEPTTLWFDNFGFQRR